MEKPTGSSWKAHLALSFVAIFYGVNYFTLKAVFAENVDSFALLAIRCIITTLFFAAYHFIAIKEKIKTKADYGRLILAALFGITLNQSMFLKGISLTSRVNASVLMITTPIFVFLMAWLLKEEKITGRKLLGLSLSFVGAVSLILLGSKSELQITGTSIRGDIFITLNAAFYGIYLVVVRPLLQRYNTFTVIKWIFIFGSIPNVLMGIVPLAATDFSILSIWALFGIFFLILFATILAYGLNAWAMKRLPSSAVGIYIYVQPVFVTLISAASGLGEVKWQTIPFIFLIFAGVWLVSWRRASSPPNSLNNSR